MHALESIFQALIFAAHKHRDQRRKGIDAVPYINHPIEVAEILLRVGKISDNEVLIAAILHDTLEDTETTPEELEQAFGPKVRAYVEEVTDDKRLPKLERKALQIQHAPNKSEAAKAIKLADKIANVRDIASNPPAEWPAARRREYLDWAEQVCAGVKGVNSELEKHFENTLQIARNQLSG